MRIARVVVTILLLAGAAPRARHAEASQMLPEGIAQFGLDITCSNEVGPSGTFMLTLQPFSAQHRPEAMGTVVVDLPEGLELIAGDTRRAVQVTKDVRWSLILRKRSNAQSARIRGSLRVPGDAPSDYDYYGHLLDMTFEGNRILVQENRATQRVAVRAGRRFRYGGHFLVAIGDDEVEAPRQFESRAELISGPDIPCNGCGEAVPMTLEIVVTVGSDGSVTWTRPRPLSQETVNPRVWSAVLVGVREFRFRPAQADGRPTADYAVIRVRVVPAR